MGPPVTLPAALHLHFLKEVGHLQKNRSRPTILKPPSRKTSPAISRLRQKTAGGYRPHCSHPLLGRAIMPLHVADRDHLPCACVGSAAARRRGAIPIGPVAIASSPRRLAASPFFIFLASSFFYLQASSTPAPATQRIRAPPQTGRCSCYCTCNRAWRPQLASPDRARRSQAQFARAIGWAASSRSRSSSVTTCV
jgi:hypothetical protein